MVSISTHQAQNQFFRPIKTFWNFGLIHANEISKGLPIGQSAYSSSTTEVKATKAKKALRQNLWVEFHCLGMY